MVGWSKQKACLAFCYLTLGGLRRRSKSWPFPRCSQLPVSLPRLAHDETVKTTHYAVTAICQFSNWVNKQEFPK